MMMIFAKIRYKKISEDIADTVIYDKKTSALKGQMLFFDWAN
jgi:hypothetical protein